MVGVVGSFLFLNTFMESLNNPKNPFYKLIQNFADTGETIDINKINEDIKQGNPIDIPGQKPAAQQDKNTAPDQPNLLDHTPAQRLIVEKKLPLYYFLMIFVAFILYFLFNLPFKMYFSIKKHPGKRGEKIFERKFPGFLEKYSGKMLIYTPEINALILGLVFIVFHIITYSVTKSAMDLSPAHLDNQSVQYFFRSAHQFGYISMTASFLSIFFLYFWQKHRVQMKYLDVIYTEEELQRKLKKSRFENVENRLVQSMAMTIILPLVVLGFYFSMNLSTISDFEDLSDQQINMIYGNYAYAVEQVGQIVKADEGFSRYLLTQMGKVTYVNFIDLMKLYLGMISAAVVILIYVIVIIRWTTSGIVKPVKEIIGNMEEVKTGNLNAYTRVRTYDEIGTLAEGYNRMLHGLQEREKIKMLFGQYLTKEVSEEILKGNINLGGDLYFASIMFSDIRDFTSMSEKMTPNEVISFLNEFFDQMIEIILKYNGIIDKFIGDGILALFGIPIKSDDHAVRALNAAIEMERHLAKMNEERKALGKEPIRIGIGIHTGNVIAGNLGNQKKLEYTVVGDTVNVASRIESATKIYDCPLMISSDTHEFLEKNNEEEYREILGKLLMEKISRVQIKGKTKEMDLYKCQLKNIS